MSLPQTQIAVCWESIKIIFFALSDVLISWLFVCFCFFVCFVFLRKIYWISVEKYKNCFWSPPIYLPAQHDGSHSLLRCLLLAKKRIRWYEIPQQTKLIFCFRKPWFTKISYEKRRIYSRDWGQGFSLKYASWNKVTSWPFSCVIVQSSLKVFVLLLLCILLWHIFLRKAQTVI